MSIERVQVATKIFNEPVPGVLVNTELGDVIYIFDRVTGTMGIHGPDKMKMKYVIACIDMVYEEFVAKGIDPFVPDDTLPLIFEDSFILQRIDA